MACSGQERAASRTEFLLTQRDCFADCRGAAVKIIEREHIWGDHRAQRVPLTALRIDPNLHNSPFGPLQDGHIPLDDKAKRALGRIW